MLPAMQHPQHQLHPWLPATTFLPPSRPRTPSPRRGDAQPPSPSPPTSGPGSKPTTASKRRPSHSGRSSRSRRSSPWAASPMGRALSLRPCLVFASTSGRSRWELAAPSSCRWFTIPPPWSLAAASRSIPILIIVFCVGYMSRTFGGFKSSLLFRVKGDIFHALPRYLFCWTVSF